MSSLECAYKTTCQPSIPSIHAMLPLGYSGDLWCAFNVCWAQLERAELAALSLPSQGGMRFTGGGRCNMLNRVLGMFAQDLTK